MNSLSPAIAELDSALARVVDKAKRKASGATTEPWQGSSVWLVNRSMFSKGIRVIVRPEGERYVKFLPVAEPVVIDPASQLLVPEGAGLLQINSEFLTAPIEDPIARYFLTILHRIIEARQLVFVDFVGAAERFKVAKHWREGLEIKTLLLDTNLAEQGASGLTLISRDLKMKNYGDMLPFNNQEHKPCMFSSPYDAISLLLIQDKQNARILGHELFGHFSLASIGAPSEHASTIEERHGVLAPDGQLVKGMTVLEFILRHIDANIPP